MEEKVSDTNIVEQTNKNSQAKEKYVLSNEEIIEVSQLAGGMNSKQIAEYFGMCEDTFLKIKKRQPEVARAYKKGKARGVAKATSVLMEMIEARYFPAVAFYLKTQAGWREKDRTDGKDEDSENNNGPTPLLVKFVTKEDLKDVTENKDDKI